jgi:hypothetical protein
MRKGHKLQRLYIEHISGPNFRVNCVRKQIPLNWRLPLILQTDRALCSKGRLKYFLGFLKEKPQPRFEYIAWKYLMFCFAVTLWSTLRIISQFWYQPAHSLTDRMRTVEDSHELISPESPLTTVQYYNSSDHLLPYPNYPYRSMTV